MVSISISEYGADVKGNRDVLRTHGYLRGAVSG
jgi:hypothetical protein